MRAPIPLPASMLAAAAAALLSTSCYINQADSCGQYLECLVDVAPGSVGEAAEYYGTDGSCWDSDQETADLCSKACSAALEAAHQAAPNADSCEP